MIVERIKRELREKKANAEKELQGLELMFYQKGLDEALEIAKRLQKAVKKNELNGSLLLPCNVGDTAYIVYGFSKNYIVVEIKTTIPFLTHAIHDRKIGETVFFTKEEAEEKATELRGF